MMKLDGSWIDFKIQEGKIPASLIFEGFVIFIDLFIDIQALEYQQTNRCKND